MTHKDLLLGLIIVAYGVGVITGIAVFPSLFPHIVFG